MESSPPVSSPSPAQGKPRDCVSKAAEGPVRVERGTQSVCTRSTKSQEVITPPVQIIESDDTTCIYCSRTFASKRGLSIHSSKCKNRSFIANPAEFLSSPNILNIPPCSVVLEDCMSSRESVSVRIENSCSGSLSCLSEVETISESNSDDALTGPVEHHSTESCRTKESEQKFLRDLPDKDPIKWPKMNDSVGWSRLDESVSGQLTEWWAGNVPGKIRCLENLLYDEAKSMFGTNVTTKTKFVPRRQKEILMWRKRLNDLYRAWKSSTDEEERAGIDLLQDDCKERIRSLKRLESSRKRRWRRRSARSKFFQNPFEAVRNILKPKISCQPEVSKSDLNSFVVNSCSDPQRDAPLGALPELGDFDQLNLLPFDNTPFFF